MSKRAFLSGTAVAVAAAGLGAFAATGFGGGAEPAHEVINAAKVEFAPAGDGTAARATERRGRRGPVVTHLISTKDIAAPADQSSFVKAACPTGTGKPIGGGVITNGAEDLAADVLSRFSPNGFAAPRNRYFIGVRNDNVAEQTFRATLVCGKGMRVR